MKQLKFCLSLVLSFVLLLGACKKDDENGGNVTPTPGGLEGRYILAVRPISSTGAADYLLTSATLDSTSLSTTGNGIEQDGTFRYYVTHKSKFFSMLYGRGDPSAVTIYDLKEDGSLNKLTNFQSPIMQAFTPVDDDILMFNIPRSMTGGDAVWSRVSADSNVIIGEGQVDIAALAGNGERAHFTWLKQVGSKVFAPYMSIKGCCADVFGTDYPDSAWIAVFSYPGMQLEKVIKDNRTSYIGAYFLDGLDVVANGDVYTFSGAGATNNGQSTSTKPSAITRVKAGTTEFDTDYFFDLSAASGGGVFSSKLHVGGDVFIVQMETSKTDSRVKWAIVNVAQKTFDWVTGTPSSDEVAYTTTTNYSPLDGKTGYIGVALTTGESYVYKIDASAKTATQGIKITGGEITAIQWLGKPSK